MIQVSTMRGQSRNAEELTGPEIRWLMQLMRLGSSKHHYREPESEL